MNIPQLRVAVAPDQEQPLLAIRERACVRVTREFVLAMPRDMVGQYAWAGTGLIKILAAQWSLAEGWSVLVEPAPDEQQRLEAELDAEIRRGLATSDTLIGATVRLDMALQDFALELWKICPHWLKRIVTDRPHDPV